MVQKHGVFFPVISASISERYSPVWVLVEEIPMVAREVFKSMEIALTPVVVKSEAALISFIIWRVEKFGGGFKSLGDNLGVIRILAVHQPGHQLNITIV